MSHDEIMNDLQYPQPEQKRDLVEVVRCKDCKHKFIENLVWSCIFGLPSGSDGYCSYGEKRDE